MLDEFFVDLQSFYTRLNQGCQIEKSLERT